MQYIRAHTNSCRDFEEHTKTNAKSVKEMQALADSYDKAVVEVCIASMSCCFACTFWTLHSAHLEHY